MSATAQVLTFPGQGSRPALVPPGEYEMAFLDFETRMMFQRAPKIILWFSVTEPGPAFGAKLARYYNAKRLMGKHGRHGAFSVGFKSDFLREYALVFNTAPPRLDRIPMSCWQSRVVRALVETVTTDSRQRRIPEPVRYSVVKEIRGLVQ